MIRTLEELQMVPADIEEVFTFFAEPANLESITPPSLRFTIITPPPIVMEKGALIDYGLRLRGLPMRWTTLITQFDPPHRFVDVQLRGPYSYWHHEHLFEPAASGTRLVDRIHYALPFGPLGDLFHGLVSRDLVQIFTYRREIIAKQFGKCE